MIKFPETFKSPPTLVESVKVPPLISRFLVVIGVADVPEFMVPFATTKFPEIFQACPAPAVLVIVCPLLFIVKSYTEIAPKAPFDKVNGCVYEFCPKGLVEVPLPVFETVKYLTMPLLFPETLLPL